MLLSRQAFTLDNKRQTSLLAGIHRRDVKRIPNKYVGKEEEPEVFNIGVRLMARLVGESEYLSGEGSPLALQLKGKANGLVLSRKLKKRYSPQSNFR